MNNIPVGYRLFRIDFCGNVAAVKHFLNKVTLMQTKNILILAAAVAFVAGLGPTALRWWDNRQQYEAGSAVQAAQVAQAARVEELAREQRAMVDANKTQILKLLTQQQSAGQHELVMQTAAKYRLANDADIQNLYRVSAQVVSNGQLLSRFRELVRSQCTDNQAQQTASAIMGGMFKEGAQLSSSEWNYERLDDAQVAPLILVRIRELLSATNKVQSNNAATTPLMRARGDHTPRLHPLVAFTLLNAQDGTSALACAWRVRGLASATVPSFDLTLWYAPSSSERLLEHDVLELKIN